MKEVAMIVLVYSAMAKMHGGTNPTDVEGRLMAEARQKLAEVCEALAPKVILSSTAVKAVIEDLGLYNRLKDQRLGFHPPKMSIAERLLLTKRKAHTAEFFPGVLDSLAIELKGSKDFSKLYAGISILGYIAAMLDPLNTLAFRQLLTFLGHRYPKIRKAAADQVYLVLLQSGNLVAEDKMGKALEILYETCWDGDLEEAKHQRSQLYEIAGLETRVLMTSSRESDKNNDKRATADENASYSSLVGSSGF